LASLIPESPWARRLVYELVYAWPGSRHATTFNVGMAPVDPDILADPALAGDAHQIQLYAELFSLAALDAAAWRQKTVVEVAAGGGGGLLYLSKRHRPRIAVGIDVSAIAAWRGRRLGVDLRQGEATHLPFEDGSFDCLVCVDALNYFIEAEFVREALRVLKPSGRLLLADSSPTFAEAEKRFQRLAQSGRLVVDTLRDVSEGARRSIRERSPRIAKAVSWVPALLRRRVREMLMVEGSERYRRWQAGEHCFAMAVLRRPAVER
jgi:SAM-dependent methyltransferase